MAIVLSKTKKDVANGKNTTIISNSLTAMVETPRAKARNYFSIPPLTTSLSSIIDACQGKIKHFSLGNRLVEDKKDVANGKNTTIISNSLTAMVETPRAKKINFFRYS